MTSFSLSSSTLPEWATKVRVSALDAPVIGASKKIKFPACKDADGLEFCRDAIKRQTPVEVQIDYSSKQQTIKGYLLDIQPEAKDLVEITMMTQ